MAPIRTHYDNLQVTRDAPALVIKAAYSSLSQTYHPNTYQGGRAEAERILNIISSSYTVLSDPSKRAAHDAWIRRQEAAAYLPQDNGLGQPAFQDYSTPAGDGNASQAAVQPVRRLIARFVDYACSALFFGTAFWLLRDPGLSIPQWLQNFLDNPGVANLFWGFISAVLWIMPESLLLTHFGTTPGKLLCGLRVVKEHPDANYWRRSFTVWVMGSGCHLPLLQQIAGVNAWVRLREHRQTDWDRWFGFRVEASPFGWMRGVAVSSVLLLVLSLNMVIAIMDQKAVTDAASVAVDNPAAYANQAEAEPAPPMAAAPSQPSSTDQQQRGAAIVEELLAGGNGTPAQAPAVPSYTPPAPNTAEQEYYRQAYPQLLEQANRGYAEAQGKLCQMYMYAKGIPQDYNHALYWCRKSAQQGNPLAFVDLGLMYIQGLGVQRDYQQALYWFGEAAKYNNPAAQNNLGYMYHHGFGVAKDYRQAVQLYRKAAEQNYPLAQKHLGDMYRNGEGVARDDRQAVYWYGKAAEQGDPQGQYMLGLHYDGGEGVGQDAQKAAYWFGKSAAQGDADAQYSLGYYYNRGIGVAQDRQAAAYWLGQAAQQGHEAAKQLLAQLR